MWKQWRPPAPTLTEQNLSNQSGKTFIVTGSNTGVGYELVQILFQHDANVYMAARSKDKSLKAIEAIKALYPESKGRLHFLHLDLADLSSVRTAAAEFLAREQQLNVIWHNAGLYLPPKDAVTEQGFDLQLGVMTIAPFLLTKLLLPVLTSTAKISPPNSVRIAWVASIAVDMSPKGGGLEMDNLAHPIKGSLIDKYSIAKVGNLYHCMEFAKRYPDTGITAVALNPGNLRSDFHRNVPKWQYPIYNLALYPARNGAYTELFAGLDPSVTQEKSGCYIHPWGRFGAIRKDLESAARSEAEGGSGLAGNFWEWTELQVKPYL